MPHYIQFSGGSLEGIVRYSTPPLGHHSAEAAKRLAEYKAQIVALPIEEQAKYASEVARLQVKYDELKKQDDDFLAVLIREGLELREVPVGETLADMYEEIDELVDSSNPAKGTRRITRIKLAFEAKAKTWRKLG